MTKRKLGFADFEQALEEVVNEKPRGYRDPNSVGSAGMGACHYVNIVNDEYVPGCIVGHIGYKLGV